MVGYCAVWYGMVWYDSVRCRGVLNGTVRYGIENGAKQNTLQKWHALAWQMWIFTRCLSFKVQCPLKVGGEGLNLGVAWNPNTLNFITISVQAGVERGEGAGATPLLIPRFPLNYTVRTGSVLFRRMDKYFILKLFFHGHLSMINSQYTHIVTKMSGDEPSIFKK